MAARPGDGAVILRRVDGDFRRLHGDPDLGAAREAELANRRRCDLSHERHLARKTHPNALAMKVEILGPRAPDIARRAIGSGPEERDGAWMDDGENLPVTGI